MRAEDASRGVDHNGREPGIRLPCRACGAPYDSSGWWGEGAHGESLCYRCAIWAANEVPCWDPGIAEAHALSPPWERRVVLTLSAWPCLPVRE